MKVLVAEDDFVSRKIMTRLLENEGYEVFSASNGEEAWNVIEREDVRLVISDWIMPELDGLALCRRLRKANLQKYVYVIIVTAKNHTEDLIKGLEAGADDFIYKPINKAELLVKLKVGRRIIELESELFEKNKELLKANELLTKMSLTDSLMDIGNRRYFHHYMEKTHASYKRHGTPYCIAMVDIDNFKSYNDTYGHNEGDSVLRLVGKAIKSTVRMDDEVFRYGGEEVVIVFSNQKLKGGLKASERVRRNIENLAIKHDRNEPFGVVTVSIGVAATGGSESKELPWEEILKEADAAVYKAKRSGKNRVCAMAPGLFEVVEKRMPL
ncbi:MAG TPA: diguanylate cyclase [Deltaproteobacteria bacterium]|nr:diguanylate cyclase [Deltaproteobacteria bacterium]